MSGIEETKLTPHQQWCIDQAAALLGQSPAAFIADSVANRAEFILANNSRTVLRAQDACAIARALETGVPDQATLQALLDAPELLDKHPDYSPVLRLESDLETACFDCGHALLNQCLARQSLLAQAMGYSETFTVCAGGRVVGFYTLAVEVLTFPSESSEQTDLNFPAHKVMLLQRLAVDREHQKRGLAKALIRDALLRFARQPEAGGAKVLLVEAQDELAQSFYRRCGFAPGIVCPSQLYVTRRDVPSSECQI